VTPLKNLPNKQVTVSNTAIRIHLIARTILQLQVSTKGAFLVLFRVDHFLMLPSNAFSDISLQHGTEFHEDPLPVLVSRPPLPPHQMQMEEEESSVGGHYAGSRSNYFPDSMSLGYYSRYP
jgi:hypothetical protein